MKKVLLVLTILITVFVSNICAQNIMTLSSGEGRPQDVVEIELSITNTGDFSAFQTEIPLGENLTYVDNSATLYRSDDHELVAAVVNGTLKIYSYSLSLSSYSGNEGKIVSFQLKLGNEPGEVVLTNTKAKLSDAAGNELPLTTAGGVVKITTPKAEVTTPTISYGHIPIRSSYNKTITVKNTGNAPLTISNLLFSDETLSCPAFAEKVVAVGSSTSFTIVYSPVLAGAVNHRITVVSDAGNGNQYVDVTADPYSVNELHLAKISAFCDSIVEVSIKVNNMDDITGFQFCVKMPTSLQYQNNSFELTSRKDDHVGFASMRNDTLVMLAYSPSNALFADNDGIIANFKVKVKGSSGTYYMYPKNTILTNTDAQNVLSGVGNGYVTVKSPKINVASSHEFAATSVTEIVSESLAIKNSGSAALRIDSVKFTSEYLSSTTAFPLVINNSKTENINVSCNKTTEGDIQGTMRIYSNDPANGLVMVKMSGKRYEPNGLVINFDEITDVKYLDVLVGLENYSEITAIQADLSYPEDYYIASKNDITLTERCSDFTKTLATVDNTSAKLLIFSMYNDIISGNEGTLCKIRLTRKDDADNQSATVSLKNIILSDVKGNNKDSAGDQIKSIYLMSNVTVGVNSEEMGSVSGGGLYHKGETVTVIATPNFGYKFLNWTENGNVVSEESEYSFVITNDRELVANFELSDYDVNVNVSPENAGTATGAGNYEHGDEVTVAATPSAGYKFLNWTENDNVVSEELEFSFNITSNRNLVANFELLTYEVNVSASPENAGAVTGAGNYKHGDEVTVTATPNAGYRFVSWTENGMLVSSDIEFVFNITSNRNLAANFELLDYDVTATASPENAGAVTGAGNYTHGETVTLTATANIGYKFVSWTENGNVVSEVSEYSFTITNDRNLVANFTLLDYDINVTVNPINSGVVTGEGNYYHGEEVTLTAIPNVGYRFVSWTENGIVVSEETTYTFVISPDRNLVANFELLDYDVTATASPENAGSVTGAGNYKHGETFTLTATPNIGYKFVSWTEDGNVISTESEYSFTITSDRNLVANFELLDYDVNVSISPENAGTTTGAGTYTYGDEVTLTATPNFGYKFVSWTENDNVVSEELEFSFNITSNRNFVANFELLDYDVNVSASPENAGSVTGAGNYKHGDEVTVTATPNFGYKFLNWTENDNVVSEELEFVFNITSNRNLAANFELLDYDVNVSASPENAGSVTGAGNYTHGDEVTVTATPNEGYKFVSWTENDVEVSSDSQYVFVVTENRNLVANFELLTYDVTITMDIEGAGEGLGAGSYTHGDEVTVKVVPTEAYVFLNWTENEEVVSTETEYTFIITSHRDLVANFKLADYDVTVSVSPEDAGVVTGTGNYTHGDEVTVTATPNFGYKFISWTENDNVVSEELEYVFTITSNRNLVANFELLTYEVAISLNIENAGVVLGAGNYTHGDNVTVTATPNENYKFVNWTENDILVSEEQTYVFEITGDRNLVANFISTENVEKIFADSFKVYPNPANRNNEINLGMTFDRVEVYNSLGVKIAEYTNTDKIDGIETAGIYVIKGFNDGNVVCCKLGIK